MSRLKISNKKTTSLPLPEPNTSNTTTINPKILIQANNTKKEYINIKNAVKILETYSNWNGYIKLYTEVESNFEIGDTIYITYLELNDYPDVFRLDNSNVIYSTYSFGYKILYVDKNKNEIVINRYYNDITPGYKLKHQYLSKVSCNGGIFYNNITDGAVFYNSNVFSSQFSTMSGHVSGVTESGTTVLSGATIEVSGLKAYTDINGYYILTVPIGQSIATCSATEYTTETVIPTILPNVNNTVNFILTTAYYYIDVYNCYCTNVANEIQAISLNKLTIGKFYYLSNTTIAEIISIGGDGSAANISSSVPYDSCSETGVQCINITTTTTTT